jgi:anti-anti-sigma factor
LELKTSVDIDNQKSLARVYVAGALNTDTAADFESRLEDVIDRGMALTVIDMKELDYISSAGLRVIFKAAKRVKEQGNRLAAANRRPHIEKVFEILKALPDMAVFANDEEMDDYLASMQAKVKSGE